jgi:hypothetical protein
MITVVFEDGGTMMTRAWARRLAAMLIAGLLIPACKDADSASILFMDQFNGVFPGTAWTPATTGSATAVRDVANGAGTSPPFASLRMSASAGTSSVTAETTASFNAPSTTFSVHMAADTSAGTDVGTGSIVIRDNSASVIASASWNVAGGGTLTLKIGSVAADVQIAAPAADLLFHRLVFTLTAGDRGTWTLDNGAVLHSDSGLTPAFPLTLELGATYPAGTGFALFYFDNVTVTAP